MNEEKKVTKANIQNYMPEPEAVLKELSSAESMDDFFGKEGIFAGCLPGQWKRCWKPK
jgi:hypothetical protein